jgi:hypothetical protein
MGGAIDGLGGPDDMGEGDIVGEEGSTDMSNAPDADSGIPVEGKYNNKNILLEKGEEKKIIDKLIQNLLIKENEKKEKINCRVNFIDNNLRINEDTQSLLEGLERKLDEIEDEFGEL